MTAKRKNSESKTKAKEDANLHEEKSKETLMEEHYEKILDQMLSWYDSDHAENKSVNDDDDHKGGKFKRPLKEIRSLDRLHQIKLLLNMPKDSARDLYKTLKSYKPKYLSPHENHLTADQLKHLINMVDHRQEDNREHVQEKYKDLLYKFSLNHNKHNREHFESETEMSEHEWEAFSHLPPIYQYKFLMALPQAQAWGFFDRINQLPNDLKTYLTSAQRSNLEKHLFENYDAEENMPRKSSIDEESEHLHESFFSMPIKNRHALLQELNKKERNKLLYKLLDRKTVAQDRHLGKKELHDLFHMLPEHNQLLVWSHMNSAGKANILHAMTDAELESFLSKRGNSWLVKFFVTLPEELMYESFNRLSRNYQFKLLLSLPQKTALKLFESLPNQHAWEKNFSEEATNFLTHHLYSSTLSQSLKATREAEQTELLTFLKDWLDKKHSPSLMEDLFATDSLHFLDDAPRELLMEIFHNLNHSNKIDFILNMPNGFDLLKDRDLLNNMLSQESWTYEDLEVLLSNAPEGNIAWVLFYIMLHKSKNSREKWRNKSFVKQHLNRAMRPENIH